MELIFIIKIAAVVLSIAGAAAYKYYYKAPDDNPIEQLAEEVIKDVSGIDIDLSPEDKKK